MQNNINIGININDGGTGEKVNKVAKEIKGNLEGAAAAAKRVPEALAAAKMGIDASNAMRSSGPARATRAPTGATGPELKDYNISRGISGATGAASRDFAAQAQGLGGLVQVYATFAANLFAVSAAFTALSKAADTSNMVKGLDQLGAVSGKSLGSLAKQLSQVTDGAISMRDAMTTTVSASAGGMTNAAILRMGVVAKQASQALGVAMPDALNRISRGITKLEPELLDEIGIMVRVDTASQAYARTLDKTASSLTDFEKRQGFANAVLEQGEKKFGAIKLDTNPYDRILASMQNIAQTGLELVNKVLGPLLNLLSSSPTALATVMAGIVGILLKQAIPALGAWRENLSNLAIEAGKTSQRINTSFAEYQVAQSQKHGDEIEKRIQVEKAAAVKSLNIAKDATKVAGLSKGKVFDITQNVPKTLEAQAAAYKLLDSQIASNTTRGLNLAASDSKASKAALDRAEALKALKAQLPELIKLENDLTIARAKAEESMYATPKLGSETWAREKNARNARIAAAKAEVLSNVGSNTQIMGIAGAWNQSKADIAEKGLKGLDAATTKLRAGMLIATSTISTLTNALMGVMMWVGIAIAGFGILNSWLSTNSKETEKFSNSLTGLTDSVDNMARTLDVIATKDPLSVFSIETIQARANALQGLSDSLTTLTKDFNDVQKASSWWDKGIDALWDAVGRGSADKLSTNIAKSISAGILGAATSAAKSEAIAKLQQILGKNIDVTNIEQVNNALRKLGNAEVAVAGAQVEKILRDISLSANNAAFALNAAVARIAEISALVQTQNLALMPTDAIGKLGASALSSASDISKGLKDPIDSMLILNKLIEDSRTLSILSPAVSQELIAANKDIKDLNDTYSRLQSDLIKGEKELQDLKTAKKDTVLSADEENYGQQVESEAAYLAKISIDKVKLAIVNAETKMAAISSGLSVKIAEDFVNIGLAKLNSSLKTAMAEGAIIAAKGYLSVLKEAGVGTADAEAKLAEQELGMQKQVLEATYNQIRSQQRNTNALELASISTRMLANEIKLADSKASETRRDAALKEQESLGKELEKAVERVKVTEMSPKQALNLKAGGSISTEVLSGMAPYLSSITGYLSGLAKLGGTAEAARITSFARKEKEVLGQEQRPNVTRIGQIGTELQDVNTAIALSAEYDKTLAIQKELLETEKRTLEYTNEALKISTDLRIIEEARKGGKVSEEEINKGISAIQADSVAKAKKFISDKNKITLDAQKEEISGLEAIRQKEETKANLVRNETQAIYSLKLTQQSDELNFLNSIGVLTAEAASRAQTEINLKQQSLAFDKQITEEANKYITAYIDLENKKILAGSNATAATSFQKDQDNLVASYLRQAEATALSNKYKVEGITLAGQQDSLAKSQTEQMEKMLSVTESLSTIFGDLGTNIGLAGQALLKMAQDDEKYLKNKTILEDKLFNAIEKNDPKAEADALKSLTTLDKKKTKDEVDNISKVVGASKKMFSEKTAGYKVLSAVEKTTQAISIALTLKDTAMKIASWATEVAAKGAAEGEKTGFTFAGFAARLPAYIGEIYASWGALGPWMVGAAAAFIAATLGGGGGGSTVNTAGLTSEDMQKSQGTGQKWVDGKLLDTGGGVFGDSEAKSNSLLNSINLIKENQIEGLSYDNKSLSILESIDKGIEKTAIALYQTQGISTGSGFGTNEASTSNAGFLGLFASSSSTEIINSGIKIGGTLANATAQQFEDVLKTKTKSGFLGIGGGTSQSLTNNIKDLNNTATEGLQEIFTNMGNLFVEQGKQLGMSTEDLKTSISSLPIEVTASLQGLKGKELREELGYVLSGIADDAANKLFPALRQYRQFGEGMSETVTRVLDSNNKYKLSLASIGIATNEVKEELLPVSQVLIDAVTTAQAKVDALKIDTRTVDVMQGYGSGEGYSEMLTTISDPQIAIDLAGANSTLTAAQLALTEATGQMTTKSIGLSETLIKNAGGLEQFLEKIKFFGDNFLTEADRLAPKQKAVTEEMARLGYSSVDTREEFKTLVKGLDLTTAAGQTNYQALMNVAEGFDVVTSAAEEAAEKTRDLQKGLLSAQGRSNDVLAMDRAQALADKSLTESDALILKATYAQEDLNKTRSLENQLLTLQGRSSEVLVRTREAELLTMSKIDAELKLRTYEAEDFAKIKDKELALLNAQGLAYDALVRTRTAEIESLRYTGETISDLGKAAQRTSDNLINSTKAINTAADAAKTRGLENELLTLQGNASEALLRTRQAELLTLSSVDASLKLRIWRLQDEAKLVDQRNSQEIAIYNLLGNSAAALQITREKELATLDEQLKPAQLYLYALQDEAALKGKLKTAYDKEKTAIKATIDSIGGMIKSLKDAKEAMLTGALSPLTPAEKYAEAKRQAVSVAILATSIATTDSEIAARNDAVSKLPSVTGAFLDASKALFASSEQYTQDFQSVLDVLDATSTILGKQKTDAEKQLDSLKSMDGYLGTIAEDTKTSADYLKDLNKLLPTLISTKAAAAAAGSVAAGGVAGSLTSNSIPKSYFEKYADVKTALTPYIASKGVSEAQLSAIHYAYWGYSEGRDNPGIALDTAAAASAFDTPRDSIIAQAELAGVKYFAKGGLASGLSMVGEQGPELVDFKTPARVYSNNATNQLLSNKELIEEIRRLRTEVSQLRTEQKEQTGHLINTNYDANMKAANNIANATEQAAVTSDWANRSKVKLA